MNDYRARAIKSGALFFASASGYLLNQAILRWAGDRQRLTGRDVPATGELLEVGEILGLRA
jgi:hypothetical protein